ncbi:MAG: hypothetical protein ABEI57_01725 [Halapricum sp.]
MNRGAGGGGGGSGGDGSVWDVGPIKASAFTTDDGTGIKWVQLATTIIGGLLMAWSVGVSAIVDAVFGLVVGGIDWLSEVVSSIVEESLGVPITVGTVAWNTAVGTIKGLSGLWVPALVLGVALGYLYLIQRGVD